MKCLKSVAAVWLACLSGNFMVQAADLPAAKTTATAPDASAPNTKLPTITANGVTTLFGKKQVLFRTAGAVQSDGSTADSSYVLEVGEGRNGIKVLSVDDDSKTVTFDNHGTVQKIPLQTAALVSAPVPAQAPVMTLESGPLQLGTPTPPADPPGELLVEQPERPQNNGGPAIVTIGGRSATATRFKHQLGLIPQGNQTQVGGLGFAPPPIPVNGVAANPVAAPIEAPPAEMHQATPPPRGGAISGGADVMAPPPH